MYEQDEMRQVIMNIKDAARYMDPAYRIFTAAGIVLVQFLARMVKEHKISRSQFKDISAFMKATEGKYDIINLPEMDMEQLQEEMQSLGIRYAVLQDLNKDDGYIQIAVYQPDKGKFQAWYERRLMGLMKGGEKEQRLLRNLTNGNTSVISIPLVGKEELVENDFLMLGINYAKLPDLNVGDGDIQYMIANSDLKKAEQWYSLFKADMLKGGEEVKDMTVSDTLDAYIRTGNMTGEGYIDTASEDIKKANEKYENAGQSSLQQEITNVLYQNGNHIKSGSTPEYEEYMQDPDYVMVSINKEALVDKMTFRGREELLQEGYFTCRLPGTWGSNEQIMSIPADRVFLADGGKTYLAFLQKDRRPLVYNADKSIVSVLNRRTGGELAKEVFAEAARKPGSVKPLDKTLERAEMAVRAPVNPLKVR